MPSLIGTDISTIAQATEQQLLNFTSLKTLTPVIGAVPNVRWVLEGDEPPPGIVGQRDILFEFNGDEIENVEGDGRFAKVKNSLIVYGRGSLALDPQGTRRDWIIQRSDPLVTAIMDALMDFFPEDADHNALTIEGFVLRRNSAPLRVRDTSTWGHVIGTYEFHYIPAIDTTILG